MMMKQTALNSYFKFSEGKCILDSSEKIILWIKNKLQEQKKLKHTQTSIYPTIDLSNCIISTVAQDGCPVMTNLCDIIEENQEDELFCSVKNGCNDGYYQEVKVAVICRDSIIHSAFFQQTRFYERVDFEGTEFRGYASFSGCLFEKQANFQKTIYSGNFNFDSCIFNDSIWFNSAKFDVCQIDFKYSEFYGNFQAQSIEFANNEEINKDLKFLPYITFEHTIFKKELDLSYTKFTRNCLFNNAKFERSVKFLEISFLHNHLSFIDSQIKGNILFSNRTIGQKQEVEKPFNKIKNINFNQANISGRIDIEQCKIEEIVGVFANINEGAIFRIYNSSIEAINFTSFCNKGVFILDYNLNRINTMILEGAINLGIIEIQNTKIKNINDRRTARILKDSALKCGNSIDAIEFRKDEMRLLKKEQKEQKQKCDFSLWLNGISNIYGTKWTRGFCFTITIWLTFYLLFLITTKLGLIWALLQGEKVKWTLVEDISNSIKYIWSPDFLDLLTSWINQFEQNVTVLQLIQILFAILFYFLGKIGIIYGIYQTVYAFRKYRR